jgi:hypothetical protein
MAIFRGIGGAGDSTTDATVTAVTQQATNAASSASAAATSASNAASSASAASTSAATATTQASNAASSATDAQTAQTAAETAQANAETVYDNFDDRYLGDKASDPTLDNDGNALLTGALYFNTTDDVMKVYNGSSWLAAYASLSGALIATNNLSDLNNVATARTNLGLGTAATTASTDYATAAQGALADTALQSFTETNDLTAAVTWANVPDANITESSVTQHEAALSITEGQISNLGADIVLDSDIGVSVQGYDADTLFADTADTLTASFRGTVTTDNDLSFDMNATNNFKCTPTSGAALTFTNITAGQSGNIWLDNSAGVTITAAATTYISAADLTTISTAGVYFMSYYSDGTNVAIAVTQAITSAGA